MGDIFTFEVQRRLGNGKIATIPLFSFLARISRMTRIFLNRKGAKDAKIYGFFCCILSILVIMGDVDKSVKLAFNILNL
jgi:hypothetical protein